jgi:hypothetical protein
VTYYSKLKTKKPVSELQEWFNDMEMEKTGNEYSGEIVWEWLSNCK